MSCLQWNLEVDCVFGGVDLVLYLHARQWKPHRRPRMRLHKKHQAIEERLGMNYYCEALIYPQEQVYQLLDGFISSMKRTRVSPMQWLMSSNRDDLLT
ncbi:hypothetical protein SADUNF_Sadunf16G0042800 [Salix dunnii]|uniref:Uncharacterized protein n=1 Tax=Salix dunnii TaxID=1413687 RepID=A0A835J9S7_9ROSI|nr:hypothetical protein SADUNF_Sadunf16G0042800 [Salix dunnii]